MNRSGGNIIPLYNTPPNGNILVEDLEKLITLRVNTLDQLEGRLQRREVTDKFVTLKKYLNDHEKEIGWINSIENDITSHFVLSVAFCKNDQERVWFSNLESKLFMIRLDMYNIDQEDVLKMLDIPLERQDNIPESLIQKIRFRTDKQHNNNNNNISTPITTYRIPFEYALNLIPTMQYFLYKGFVYISKAEISQLIETVFKENLTKKLVYMNRNIDRITSDGRISYLIKDLQVKREVETLSKSFQNNQNEALSYKDIDMHAERSFPLCMQILHKNLTANGHLKHFGRLQYGLFLKGIGLSLEESLQFWRTKFSKSMTDDKFEKNYSYNVRHSYGKEGKRNDYIPYSCTKVQNLPVPSASEHHGCPYKVFSEEKLKAMLFEMKFKELDVLKILEKKRNNEFSVACIKYFEAKHPNGQYEKVGIHPNHYFESSVKLSRKDGDKPGYSSNKNYSNNKQNIAYESENK